MSYTELFCIIAYIQTGYLRAKYSIMSPHGTVGTLKMGPTT